MSIYYQKYNQYSPHYMIDLSLLKQQAKDTLDQWITDNCYYIISSACDTTKLLHNLSLAKKLNDLDYIEFLNHQLHINVVNWEYKPIKIKIHLKCQISLTQKQREILPLDDHPIKYKSDIVRLYHKYIAVHQLQNRFDLLVFTPDNNLQSILTPLSDQEYQYTYLSLPQHIK